MNEKLKTRVYYDKCLGDIIIDTVIVTAPPIIKSGLRPNRSSMNVEHEVAMRFTDSKLNNGTYESSIAPGPDHPE